MTVTVPELEPSATDPLHEALVQFTAAIGNQFEDICSYGLTIGEAYVPFDPDPEDDCSEDDIYCSQVWVRVVNIRPKPGATVGWDDSCGLQMVMDLEVGVLRCFDVPANGEAPTTTQVLEGALQAMTDQERVLKTALATEVWTSIAVGSWSPLGPLGAQYGGQWSFTVEYSNGCLPSET